MTPKSTKTAKSTSIPKRKGKRLPGYSFLEVALVVGIAAIAAGFAAPAYENYRFQNDLSVTASQVIQSVDRAHTLALSNKNDSAWGVSFSQAILFQGISYATRVPAGDESMRVPATITINGLPEIFFSRLDGKINDTGVIILTASNGSQLAIVIDSNGVASISKVTPDLVAAANSSHSYASSRMSSSALPLPPLSSSVRSSVALSSSVASVTSSAAQASSVGASVGSSAASVSSAAGSAASSAGGGGGDTSSSAVASSVASSVLSSVAASSVASSAVASSVASSILSSAASSSPAVTWQNQNVALLLLDPSMAGALTVSGNGGIKVSNANGKIVINSNNAAAMKISGNGSAVAVSFDIKGVPGTSVSGNGKIGGVVHSNVAPSADPLVNLPIPSQPSQTYAAVSYSGNGTITLNPGTYSGISVSGNANVILNPGIYYVQSGTLQISGNASVTGNGVMMYFSNYSPSAHVSLSGNGSLTLSPLSTGTYAGISLFLSSTTFTKTMLLSGNGVMNVGGIIYGPSTELQLSGNGAYLNLQCLQSSRFIFKDVKFTGNGGFNVQ